MESPRHYFTKPTYIIEGMDMVGKTTFLRENLPDHKIYHPRHDLTDSTVGRQNSWVIGYGIVDFLEQTSDSPIKSVIDRGVFSSYVYERLYNNHYLDKKILDWYKNNKFFVNSIGHIYICHHDATTAQEIFEKSQKRDPNPNELSNKYDQFKSFNDYWIFYTTADQLFREVYDYIGVRPRVFETLPNMMWNEIKI